MPPVRPNPTSSPASRTPAPSSRCRASAAQDDYDSPWKDAVEHAFPEFIDFYFPTASRQIDWARGHTFLDKELQQIAAAVGFDSEKSFARAFREWTGVAPSAYRTSIGSAP